MNRPNPMALWGTLIVALVLLGGAAIAKGAFLIGRHEGDTAHVIDIVLRMAAGERPHLDFVTPLGALSFAPIVAFVAAGLGVGMAMLWAQVLMAALMLPMVAWIACSRLTQGIALYFSLVVMVLMLALVHGEALQSISISMHYNRWAWAMVFVAIIAAILPPLHPKNAVIDGVIVGILMAGLVMIKVTYFISFAPGVALGLWLTGQRRTLAMAALTGIAIAAGLTLWLGGDYWIAYINDLRTVAGSTVRPAPGQPFGAVVGAPQYLAGSLVAIFGVILLRQARMQAGGLVLLLLVPGFFYVTYQNFGNDPIWLLLMPVILLSLRPTGDLKNGFGWPLRSGLTMLAGAAIAVESPSLVNMAYSPLRHLRLDLAEYAPLLPRDAANGDIMAAVIRAKRVDARVGMDADGKGFEEYFGQGKRDEASTFKGETFDYCTTELGLPAYYDTIARDLENAGLANGSRIFAADLFSFFHLYGDFKPLIHGAPWYYGGLPGYQSADYLLLPICPIAQDIQQMILTDITEAGDEDKWTEVRRTPVYVLYAKEG